MTRLFVHHAAHGVQGGLLGYVTATMLFGAGLAARFLARPYLPGEGFPFLSFFPVVVIAAFLTSIGPALWCALLCTLAAWYFFMTPYHAFFPLAGPDVFALLFFAAVLVVDCVVISIMRNVMARLRIAEAQLMAADKQKNDFINVMAHELRAPLQVIGTTALLLRRQESANITHRIDVIERQAKQMNRLVDDLLDAARMTSGKLHVDKQAIDLNLVIENTVEAFTPLLAAHRQRIVVLGAGTPAMVCGDAARLTQVLENLLSNASKFSPPDSIVQLGIHLAADTAEVSVRDFGKGLDSKLLTRIFDMYTQSGPADAAKGGLGLGLALSKQIIALHEGQIFAHSAGPGQGSTICFRLPLYAGREASVSSGTRTQVPAFPVRD